MPALRRLAPILCVAMGLAGPAHGGVTVTFSDPDRFTDVGDRDSDPRKIMQALEKHIRAAAARVLPPEERLAIEVLDLNRAGRPRRDLPNEIRIMNGRADMPCIEMRYTLDAAPPRRETLCDPDYLRPLPFTRGDDPLAYEKRMLDVWFARRFGRKAPPR